jgi:hypothetical protein
MVSAAVIVTTATVTSLGHVGAAPLDTSSTVRVSVADDGAQSNAASRTPSMTPDGGVVAFETLGIDGNGLPDIYVRDLRDPQAPTTTRVSVATPVDASGQRPSIDDAARFVAFDSTAATLVVDDPTTPTINEADTNGTADGSCKSCQKNFGQDLQD